jgi:glycosyltransferase involved in cell wall biosynthesis
MIGRKPGHVTMQGQVLSALFARADYRVIAFSEVLNRYLRLLDIIRSIVRNRNRIDVMVIEVYGGPSFVVEDIASWLGKRFGHRIVMWLHGGAMPTFMAGFPNWTKRVLGRADLIVTPSEFLARAVEPYGFRAKVIPNVIDLPAYRYRNRASVSPRLFWMRNLDPIWNPEMAIRVLARLRKTVPQATLVMAGPDKGSRPEVENLAKRLGVYDSVKFAGFLDMEGKVRESEAADIFINTNRIDNMPVAIVEACAMGLPVVSTNVGGIPDLLTHDHTGLLVDSDDETAMTSAIVRLLEEPNLASRLSANGRRLAERSSWAQVRQQWEAAFAEVMVDSPIGISEPALAAVSRTNTI